MNAEEKLLCVLLKEIEARLQDVDRKQQFPLGTRIGIYTYCKMTRAAGKGEGGEGK